ncbi:MAG TPA: PIG-L family deacetylase [Patescibacteria group bacterium]|jgi:LmbE family N-acetylglucosaminyl deacetylase|nr:PIG-L family deacetylase [Patescibacteria group bacterium]
MTNDPSIYGLAIVAHPDDETFLLAGTCLKFADEGKRVGVVCATRGEKGADRLNRNLSQPEMAKVRVKELQTACTIIKCAMVEYFDYPDGELDKADFKQLVQKLAEKIDQYKPAVILTFGEEGISGHKDHIVIGHAAVAAASAAKHKVNEIWLASMPVSAIEKFNQHLAERKVHHSHFQKQKLQGVADEKLMMIDIQKHAAQKHQALKAHKSQYLPRFVLDIFLKYECFEVIKP